jgi:hypothetical protein
MYVNEYCNKFSLREYNPCFSSENLQKNCNKSNSFNEINKKHFVKK